MISNAYSADYLWILDPCSKSCKRFHVPFETTLIDVLSGDDKHAVAILNYSAPFELAIFDLVSETSAVSDFAPVEMALTAAGFEMSEIKFQSSSTGKIIVSDGKKAALLEFSGLACAAEMLQQACAPKFIGLICPPVFAWRSWRARARAIGSTARSPVGERKESASS